MFYTSQSNKGLIEFPLIDFLETLLIVNSSSRLAVTVYGHSREVSGRTVLGASDCTDPPACHETLILGVSQIQNVKKRKRVELKPLRPESSQKESNPQIHQSRACMLVLSHCIGDLATPRLF